MKRYKLKKGRLMFCLLVLASIIIITVIFITTRNIIMQKRLSNEVYKLVEMDIMNDRYEVKLSASGKYGKVEKAIKTYLKDYSESLQTVIKILNDEQLKTVLSANNYQKDGPEFKNTITYLEKTKKDFNENMNKLIKLSKKEEILKYIEKENLGNYYVDLYKEYMFDEGIETNIKNSQLKLQTTTNSINNLINVDIEVINFLIQNKDNWKIENDTIVFYKQELLDEYNRKVANLS